MSYDISIRERLRRVQPEKLVQFAAGGGWLRISNKRQDVAVLNAPPSTGRYSQLIVPLRSDLDDYPERMADAIDRLARTEARPTTQIVDELLAPPADILRFRLDDPLTADGSVPFLDGLELMRGAERSLRAAACSTVEAKKIHQRLNRNESDQMLQNTRLVAERGSYLTVIIVPMDAVHDDTHQGRLFNDQPVPFVRRTTSLLMKSVQRVQTALASGNPSLLDSGDVVVSANLCEALLAMQPLSSEGRLELSCAWARTVPIEPDVPKSVDLRKEYFRGLEDIVDQMTPKDASTHTKFVGKVAALMGKPNDKGEMEGDIVMQFQHEDELLRAKLNLTHIDYDVACDAHKIAGFVSVEGLLLRRARLHQVANYSSFSRVS